ncbi:sphinganine C4-monooxygenase 1-like [Triticum aestivum]|uniref:sphinganine C4-monooxygenase 1-like n=1 Tax=Triticum aestivum TaxID=4565 RepID=UPI001D022E92|nr:sphinganine C4-monooxygenase 1-like [Triticum aestivum]
MASESSQHMLLSSNTQRGRPGEGSPDDVWKRGQYAWHRCMHLNKFLYQRVHSWHHRLIVPYALGTQYNHPVEGLLLDTVGGVLAFLAPGMSRRVPVIFFTLCTVKGVDDHYRLWLSGERWHRSCWNNTVYHDVHHQTRPGRYNFSQPFFVMWDKVFGMHMPYVVEHRPQGGLHARPMEALNYVYCVSDLTYNSTTSD